MDPPQKSGKQGLAANCNVHWMMKIVVVASPVNHTIISVCTGSSSDFPSAQIIFNCMIFTAETLSIRTLETSLLVLALEWLIITVFQFGGKLNFGFVLWWNLYFMESGMIDLELYCYKNACFMLSYLCLKVLISIEKRERSCRNFTRRTEHCFASMAYVLS